MASRYVHMTMRPIPGYPEYQVNEMGQVRGRRGWILSPGDNGNGYLYVCLRPNGGVPVCRYVHHLVLETFIGPRPDGQQTRHLNGDRGDNRLSNLAWGTAAENAADKVRHGTQSTPMEKCQRGHPMEGHNVIHGKKPNGAPRRACRACYLAVKRKYDKRRRSRSAS